MAHSHVTKDLIITKTFARKTFLIKEGHRFDPHHSLCAFMKSNCTPDRLLQCEFMIKSTKNFDWDVEERAAGLFVIQQKAVQHMK